ncbi:MAG: hypothetical protein V3U24_00460 [Candidatus Neomarinimicrobiota bacterium]
MINVRGFVGLALLTLLNSQPTTQASQIHGVAVEEKANGTVIRIGITGAVSSSQVTAWISQSGWLYVTLLETAIDTNHRWPVLRTGTVSRFEAHSFPDAVQLDFKLSRAMESPDIGVSPSGDEVMITLRSPVAEVLGTLDRLSSRKGDEVEIDESKTESRTAQFTQRLPHALILAGSGLVLAGLIDSNSAEFIGGSAIIVAGYISIKKATPGGDQGYTDP